MKQIFLILIFLFCSTALFAQNEDKNDTWLSEGQMQFNAYEATTQRFRISAVSSAHSTAKSGYAWIGTTPEQLTASDVNIFTVIPKTSGINLFFSSDSTTLTSTTGTQLSYLQPVTFTTDNVGDWWWRSASDSVYITWFGEN